MRELEALKIQEADTEYVIEFLPRTLAKIDAKIVVRLPRHVWVLFDLLVCNNIMNVDDILHKSQLGVERYPERTFDENVMYFVQHAAYELKDFLK